MNPPVYLDNNATTPLDEEVWKAMAQFLPLNPSSAHSYGIQGKQLLTQARGIISKILGVRADEVFFTSGGTESMSTLIQGLYSGQGTILTSSIEHPCIDETLKHLYKKGASVIFLPVDSWGAPSLELIEKHLCSAPISLMVFSAVYSETGVKLDITALSRLAMTYNTPLIIDGVALLGKESFKIPLGIAGMGFSAHKLHGPKGIGAAFISSKYHFNPLLHGGHQEHAMRPGTENLEGILGFAKAVAIADSLLPQTTTTIQALRDLFEVALKTQLPNEVFVNGDGPRICNTSNIFFHGVDGESLVLALDRVGIYASLGSACSSGAIEPSRILLGMGYSRERAKSSLRFSLSRKNFKEEIEKAVIAISQLVKKLKKA